MQITIDYHADHKTFQRARLIDAFTVVGFKRVEKKPLYDELRGVYDEAKHSAIIGLLLINKSVVSYTLSKED